VEKNVSSDKEKLIMGESAKKIVLEIVIEGEKKELSFPNIESLDNFTVQFKDANELTEFLFNSENFLLEFIKIKYSYKSPKTGKITSKYLPIKYSGDNFDEISLRDYLIKYLQEHKIELKNKEWEVPYIIERARQKTHQEGNITDSEILNAVYQLWTHGYKTKRDKYFMLKQKKVIPKILPTSTYYKKTPKSKEIIDIDNIDSSIPYIQYLQSAAKQGEEERYTAIQELSMFDLEVIINSQTSQSGGWLDEIAARMHNLSPKRRQEFLNEVYKLRYEFSKSMSKKRCKK